MENTVKILVLPAELSGKDEKFFPSHFLSKFIHVGAHLAWPLRNGFFRAIEARGTQISGKQILTKHSTIAREYVLTLTSWKISLCDIKQSIVSIRKSLYR